MISVSTTSYPPEDLKVMAVSILKNFGITINDSYFLRLDRSDFSMLSFIYAISTEDNCCIQVGISERTVCVWISTGSDTHSYVYGSGTLLNNNIIKNATLCLCVGDSGEMFEIEKHFLPLNTVKWVTLQIQHPALTELIPSTESLHKLGIEFIVDEPTDDKGDE